MEGSGEGRRAVIPEDFSRSPHPLQYYFELRREGGARFHPGLGPDWTGPPYHVIRRARES